MVTVVSDGLIEYYVVEKGRKDHEHTNDLEWCVDNLTLWNCMQNRDMLQNKLTFALFSVSFEEFYLCLRDGFMIGFLIRNSGWVPES